MLNQMRKQNIFPVLLSVYLLILLSIGTHRAISTKVTGGGFKSINFQQIIFVWETKIILPLKEKQP